MTETNYKMKGCPATMNRTPFVRQYGILITNGVLLCQKGSQNTAENSSKES